MIVSPKTAAGAVAVVSALALGGWTAAGSPRTNHVAASAGRVLKVSYEVVREPPYVPPPLTEALRLDVSDTVTPTVVEEGVLSAQAADALRAMETDEAVRTAAALKQVRAQDARIDRETDAAFDAEHVGSAAPAGAGV